MRKHPFYKMAAIIVILLILSTSIPSAITGKKTYPLERHDDVVKISVNFSGLGDVKNYTMRITREKYEELCKIFDDTLKSLQNTRTEKEAREIFNETILKLREIGIISTRINITKLQKLVTGDYISDVHRNRIQKTIEKLNLTEKWDNALCLICGYAFQTCKMGFSNRIYDLLVRTPSFLMIQLLAVIYDLLFHLFPDGLPYLLDSLLSAIATLFDLLFLVPLSGPLSLAGTLCFGSEWVCIWEHCSNEKYPSSGLIWTKGLKGTKTWNGEFYGNFSRDVFFVYFPLLFFGYMLLQLENLMGFSSPTLEKLIDTLMLPGSMYLLFFYWLPLWLMEFGDPYPGAIGFTGIYISTVPYIGPSFFLGHAIGVSVREA